METTKRSGIFYGWFIVAASFFVIMMTMGARNGVGVFVLPMSEEFNWSRSIISFAAALGILLNGVSQPILGNLYDRVGGRKLILYGATVIGITALLLAFTFHIAYFIFIFGIVMAVAMSAGSITTGAVIVSKWFQRKRATAIGITAAGASVGGLILVPFTTYLIELLDWRLSWAILGSMILVLVLPVAFLVLRNSPADMGLQPDGDAAPSSTGPRRQRPVGPLEVDQWRHAFRSWPMWQLCATYFVCGFTTLIMAFHFVPNAVESGFSPATAATAFGVLSAMNTIGVIIVGPIADKLGNKTLLGLVYFFRGVGYVLLLTLPGQWGLWIFAIVGGSSWIATVPLTTGLTADIYGLKKVGTLSGMIFLSHQIGGSIGIQFGGIMRDITGSYDVPFAASAGLLLFAAVMSMLIQERRYSVKYQPVQTSAAPAAG
ncbi:MAG: MFS transporter [Chloroflexi bacterium]|nr:MFS transporter [Chloroflexota bacterium]